MNQYLDIAIAAVKRASTVCSQIQSQLVHSDTLTKKDRSPVTIADFASQALICSMLNEKLPEIPVVGEEDAASLREDENAPLLQKILEFLPDFKDSEILEAIDLGNKETAPLFWTLDPIDGTKGFLRGDQYAVALALIRNGRIEAGVLGCPNLPFNGNEETGTLFYAGRGNGAFMAALDGGEAKPVSVSKRSDQDVVRFLESVESGHANHDQQGRVMEIFGDRTGSVRVDSQVKYGVLAKGDAEVYLRMPNPSKPDYREKIWDHAAGVIIVEEAGGRVTDLFGKDLDFSAGAKLLNNRGVIVTNNRFHDAIITHINK